MRMDSTFVVMKSRFRPAVDSAHDRFPMNRSLVRYVLPVFLGSACVMISRVVKPGKKDLPNILLFAVDSLGWQDTSVPFLVKDGQTERTPFNAFYNTPGMEQLALHGVRMTAACGAPDGRTGLASLMTGMDPVRCGVHFEDNEKILMSSMSSPEGLDCLGKTDGLSRLMKKAGYRTIASGVAGTGSGRDGFDVRKEACDDSGLREEIGKSVRDGDPFFACISRDLRMFNGISSGEKRTFPEFPEEVEANEETLRQYASSVEAMDASLGALLQVLEDLGVAGRTLVLFVALSGGDAPIQKSMAGNVSWVERVGAAAPLRGRKCSRYEGGALVPMIAAWAEPDPQEDCQKVLPIVQDSHQGALVSLQDILPTLAAVAGVSVHGRVDGYNIADYLSGAGEGERPQWVVRHFPCSHPYGRFYSSLRIREWKVIYNYFDDYAETGNPAWQLFNLEEDPSESRNLASDPAYARLLSVMAGKLAAYLDSIRAPRPLLTDPESPKVNGRRTVTGTAEIRLPVQDGFPV